MITRGLSYDPYSHAQELNIPVVHRELEKGMNGCWVSDLNAIFLRRGMRPAFERATLAHELAHATLGHRSSSPENEKAADELATFWLIDELSTEASNECRPDLRHIAMKMNVAQYNIELFLGIPKT